jgi:hypothetical protein
VSPSVNPHLMTMRVKQGFWLSADRPTLLVSALSPVPSSICIALIDLNWRHTVKEEFATLITNNT